MLLVVILINQVLMTIITCNVNQLGTQKTESPLDSRGYKRLFTVPSEYWANHTIVFFFLTLRE